MLEIRNRAGMVLELPVDSRISVEINSTIFDTDDIIRGSYSYPFQLPLTENNCRFLDYGHLPERDMLPEILVQVAAGTHIFSATLIYKTQGFYADASLLIDLGAIADALRNQPLREFVTETFFIAKDDNQGGQTLKSLALAEPNVFPVVFPPFYNESMVNEDFRPEDANGNPIENYKRPLYHNLYYNWAQIYPNVPLGSADKLLVPMVYVGWLINYICKKLGFSAQGTFFTDPVLSRLIIYNTQSIPGYDNDVNGYKVEVGRHLGDYTITDILKGLRSYIGLSIDFNITSRKATFNTYNSLYRSKNYTDLSDCLIANTEGNDGVEDKGYLVSNYFDSSDKYAEYEPGTWLKQIEPRQFKKVYSFSTGNSAIPVSLTIGTLMMRAYPAPRVIETSTPNPTRYLLPTADQAGNLSDTVFENSPNYAAYYVSNDKNAIPPAVNSFGLRMLIYWGMQQDAAGDLYPYASSVSYDSKYLQIGKLSLQAGEPDDIWNMYQRKYYEFLSASKRITSLMRISLGKLSEISPSVPIGYRSKNYVTGRYILDKLTYELPAKEGFVMAKFEGRQLLPKSLVVKTYIDPTFNCWVQMILENYTTTDGPGGDHSSMIRRADVIVYIWKDGLYTTPETNRGLTFNYRKFVTNWDVNQIAKTVTTDETMFISGHRTVLESQAVHLRQGQPQGWQYSVSWAPRDGEGYRAR